MQDKHISSFLQIINIPISAIKLHKKKKNQHQKVVWHSYFPVLIASTTI